MQHVLNTIIILYIYYSFSAIPDFLPVSETLTFGPSTAVSQCRNVTVVNDIALESDELVQLALESSDSAVTIPNPIANVVIIDLDREYSELLILQTLTYLLVE